MKYFLSAVLVLLIAITCNGQFKDSDGRLAAHWNPPTFGDPVSHYAFSYDINGIKDSISGGTSLLYDSSAVLTNLGDSAVFHIVAISIFNDTSATATSGVAVYAKGIIGPPIDVIWVR